MTPAPGPFTGSALLHSGPAAVWAWVSCQW